VKMMKESPVTNALQECGSDEAGHAQAFRSNAHGGQNGRHPDKGALP